MDYYKELYGNKKPLNWINNDKVLIDEIIKRSYNTDSNIDIDFNPND